MKPSTKQKPTQQLKLFITFLNVLLKIFSGVCVENCENACVRSFTLSSDFPNSSNARNASLNLEESKMWKEAVCSYISTSVSSFLYNRRIGLSNIQLISLKKVLSVYTHSSTTIYLSLSAQVQKYIPLYEHYTDKNNKTLVQISCTLHSVHCVNIPSIFTPCQF